MPLTAKILACVAVLFGAFALAVPFLSASPGHPLATFTVAWLLAVGVTTVAAGYFCFLGKPWAAWVLLIVFLAQTLEYFSQTQTFTLVGPLPAVRFGWGWLSPPSRVNINILAVVICLLSLQVARSLTSRSTRP
jgi:hypothetical protein